MRREETGLTSQNIWGEHVRERRVKGGSWSESNLQEATDHFWNNPKNFFKRYSLMFKFQNTRLLICKGCYIHVEQKLYLSTGKRINSTLYAVSFIDCKLILCRICLHEQQCYDIQHYCVVISECRHNTCNCL